VSAQQSRIIYKLQKRGKRIDLHKEHSTEMASGFSTATLEANSLGKMPLTF